MPAFLFGHGTKRTLHPTPLKGNQENISSLLRDTNHQYFLLSQLKFSREVQVATAIYLDKVLLSTAVIL